MIKPVVAALAAMLTCLPPAISAEQNMRVKITPELKSVQVKHQGKDVTIQRNQDITNTIVPHFQGTSRKCPPFCIQPMKLADGVETIDEIKMLDYLKRASAGDDSILIIDSRNPTWLRRGTIPGSVNIHYQRLRLKSGDEEEIATIMEEQFGARRSPGGEFWDYRRAKTLVLFCNGMWCGQAPTNIKSLLRIGYPPSKLKWYRGGMQDWETLGLTTVTPD